MPGNKCITWHSCGSLCLFLEDDPLFRFRLPMDFISSLNLSVGTMVFSYPTLTIVLETDVREPTDVVVWVSICWLSLSAFETVSVVSPCLILKV